MKEELKPMTADEYVSMPKDDLAGKPHRMPSGAVWLIAAADMEELAMSGDLPMSLVSAAIKSVAPKRQEVDIEAEDVDEKAAEEQIITARELTREHVISPTLGYGGPRGALGVIDSKGEWHRPRRGDLKHAWRVVSGQAGADPYDSFRGNRKERRARASERRGGKVRGEAEPAASGQPA